MSWTNEKPLSLRQKLAIKLLFVAIKIVAPYEYDHQFEKEWKGLEDLLLSPENQAVKKPEVKKK